MQSTESGWLYADNYSSASVSVVLCKKEKGRERRRNATKGRRRGTRQGEEQTSGKDAFTRISFLATSFAFLPSGKYMCIFYVEKIHTRVSYARNSRLTEASRGGKNGRKENLLVIALEPDTKSSENDRFVQFYQAHSSARNRFLFRANEMKVTRNSMETAGRVCIARSIIENGRVSRLAEATRGEKRYIRFPWEIGTFDRVLPNFVLCGFVVEPGVSQYRDEGPSTVRTVGQQRRARKKTKYIRIERKVKNKRAKRPGEGR